MRPDGESLRKHLRLTPAERAVIKEQAEEMRYHAGRLVMILDDECEAMDAIVQFTHVVRTFEYMQGMLNRAVNQATHV